MDLPADQIRAFLDAAPDAMVVVDATGTIAFVNAATEAMFGYSRDELVGVSVDVLLPERLRDRHAAHLHAYRRAPRRRPMGAGEELYARRKDGSEFPVEISLSPVATERGNYVSSAIRDATARKLAEQKLVEAREFAERANRAKSAFLAAASHDLRQPLQTLTLLTSMLNRVVPSDSTAATAVASQSEALRLMAELINALLDISKLDAGAIQPDLADHSVKSIFAGLRTEFASLAEAKGLALIIEDSDVVVRTDATLLRQIIQNLLANAIRYTRQGWVRLRALVAFEMVRIEVVDTGIGIPANELDLIFDEYYQASRSSHESHDGVGLGLAIVRRIAHLLGCALEVRSTVGEGSCFSVSVKKVAGAISNVQPIERAVTPPEGALVLVIDDNEAVGKATAMLLGAEGLDVIVALDLDAALQQTVGQGRIPSLLICDYRLGNNMNGVDAIRAVREATRATLPTILVSGDTSSAARRAFSTVERCQLLNKPVDPDRLLELTARLLGERN